MGVANCDDVEVKRLFPNVVTTTAAVQGLDEAIRTVVATLENIEELKPELEECVNVFIKCKAFPSYQWGLGKG